MEEKIINLLTLIHRENEAILTLLLQHISYPEHFEQAREETINSWEEYYMSIMNPNPEEKGVEDTEEDKK